MFTTPLRALRFPPNSLMATTIGDDHTKRFSTVPVLYVQPVHLVGMASGGEPGLRHSLEKGETTISMQNRIRRRRKNIVLTRKKTQEGVSFRSRRTSGRHCFVFCFSISNEKCAFQSGQRALPAANGTEGSPSNSPTTSTPGLDRV